MRPQAPSVAARPPQPTDAGGGRPTLPLTLDVLGDQGSSLAPGMKEIVRFESDERSVRREIVRAPERDVCTRVAFAAGSTVHAWLEDAAAVLLSDGGRTASGALGARGPVCVRRGGAIVLRIEAETATTIRVVAWIAP